MQRLEALCALFRDGGAKERAEGIRTLPPAACDELDGALIAAWVVDPSLQVRSAAQEALARRSEARQLRRPAPQGAISEAERVALVTTFSNDPTFVTLVLTKPRGCDLLGQVALERYPLDDFLVRLARDAEPHTLHDILALPFDVSGRAVSLLDDVFSQRLRGKAREILLEALVWSQLQSAGVTSADERERAQTAVCLWVEGLLKLREDAAHLDVPTFDAFVQAGGAIGSGVVTKLSAPPSPPTVAHVQELTRALYLLAVVAREPVLDPDLLPVDPPAGLAELRVISWRLRLANGLSQASEVLEALEHDPAPGVVVELLHALPGEVDPALAGRVAKWLEHPRASVRLAAAEVLARNPLLAALAAAGLDPHAFDVPLEVLAAQPPALAAPALVAYLEVEERSSEQLTRALNALQEPPPSTWNGWERLLGHGRPELRAAAQAALLRLPRSEGPGVERLLPFVLRDDPSVVLRVIDRFGLDDRHGEVGAVLLREASTTGHAKLATRIFSRYADATSWAALWSYVTGTPHSDEDALGSRRRFGTREGRAVALEALIGFAPDARRTPTSSRRSGSGSSWTGGLTPIGHASWNRSPHGWDPEVEALAELLEDRDPWQVRLAVRFMARRGVPAELEDEVHDLLHAALEDAGRPRAVDGGGRRRWAGWVRFWRPWVPGRWLLPPRRGGAGNLAEDLLELALRLGVGGLWADDVEPLLAHGARGVRRAAVRTYFTLRGARSLPEVVATSSGDVVQEAIRVGHPEQVEALVLEGLGEPSQREQALEWAALRPRVAFVEPVAQLLHGPWRGEAVRVLRAIGRRLEGEAPVRAILRAEIERAVHSQDDAELRQAVELIEGFGDWALVPVVAPAIAWARESGRKQLMGLIRRCQDEGHPLPVDVFTGLLVHPLAAMRVFGLSMLRKLELSDLWSAVRPHGPFGPGDLGGSARPTEFMKPFLGVCEDHFTDSMGLAVEGCLGHASGEVARRALKLLNRQERELSCVSLLGHLDDPELRTPILTTFSRWSLRFLDPERRLSAELLEEERRKVRALIAGLVDASGSVGGAARAEGALAEAWEHPVVFVRGAALFAVGRLGLGEHAAQVEAGLSSGDPVLERCAAAAAGSRAIALSEAGLERLWALSTSRSAEVRASARQALIGRLDPTERYALEGLISDPSPEVRLSVLAACLTRPEVLEGLALEARLGDDDPRVRERVLRALAARGHGRALALRGPLADPVPEVRQAALEVVGAWRALGTLRREVGDRVSDPSIHVSGAALDLLEAAHV